MLSQTTAQLNNLDEMIEKLTMKVEKLGIMLQPVRREEPVMNGIEDSSEPTLCPLAKEIRYKHNKVLRLYDEVQTFIDELEL